MYGILCPCLLLLLEHLCHLLVFERPLSRLLLRTLSKAELLELLRQAALTSISA